MTGGMPNSSRMLQLTDLAPPVRDVVRNWHGLVHHPSLACNV
jgi:hypothetical protein